MNQMTRREFLSRTRIAVSLAGAAALVPRRLLANPLGLPIGIQLWTVREPLASDPAGTFVQLTKIGYREVESAGYGRNTPKEFRNFIDAAGLKCPSAHLPFAKGVDFGPLFDEAHTLGCTFATSSKLLPPASNQSTPSSSSALGIEGFRYIAELMNEIGAQAKAAGLRYAYHNHSHEFEVLPDGMIGYDYLLKHTDPELVKFEIDCGWMTVAGHSPAEYMRKYPGRFRMLHIKDFKPLEKGSATAMHPQAVGSELGRGYIRYEETFAAAKSAGIQHIFAEQEPPFAVSQMDSAKADYAYLHSFS